VHGSRPLPDASRERIDGVSASGLGHTEHQDASFDVVVRGVLVFEIDNMRDLYGAGSTTSQYTPVSSSSCSRNAGARLLENRLAAHYIRSSA
jgi:hypothetical protein